MNDKTYTMEIHNKIFDLLVDFILIITATNIRTCINPDLSFQSLKGPLALQTSP